MDQHQTHSLPTPFFPRVRNALPVAKRWEKVDVVRDLVGRLSGGGRVVDGGLRSPEEMWALRRATGEGEESESEEGLVSEEGSESGCDSGSGLGWGEAEESREEERCKCREKGRGREGERS